MSNPFSIPRFLAKNPLGIIALFILLIYGISALLLGLSVGDVALHNETILVVFIVLFPFVVLGVFAWLVSCHHMKLYGPNDYQDDKNFLSTCPQFDPKTIGEKYSPESKRAIVEGLNDNTASIARSSKPIEHDDSDKSLKNREEKTAFDKTGVLQAEAYLAESLVFQELQNITNGRISRDVSFVSGCRGNYANLEMIDGVVEEHDTVIGVEVVFLRNADNCMNRIKRSIQRIISFSSINDTSLIKRKYEGVVAIVVSHRGIQCNKEVFNQIINELVINFKINCKMYVMSELLEKYGFQSPGGKRYYVNKTAQPTGEHEIHSEGCSYGPMPENRLDLGLHASCEGAMRMAKGYFDNIEACYYCCHDCRRRE